jgi:hypothetical protein
VYVRQRTDRVTHFPYKGDANYFSIVADGKTIDNAPPTVRCLCLRADGQTRNEDERYLQLHVTRDFDIGRHRFMVGVNVFNLLNNGAMTQWNTGANQLYSPNYLSRFNRTSSRQAQFTFKFTY